MALRLVSLASGSKGNATLIMSKNTALLQDAGISYNRLKDELKSLSLSPDCISGVVITHEHSDHIAGLEKLSNVCKVYAHPITKNAIYSRLYVNNFAETENYENGFYIGDIYVEPFRIPHDAAYPLAYSFEADGERVSVATDIGVPTRGLLRNIRDSKTVLIEANHDLTMLKNGKYPPVLKQRILSDIGHLSNDDTARIVEKLCIDSKVKHLMLGHLSENNNTEKLAYDAVKRIIDGYGADITLSVAKQRERSEEL